LAQDEASSLVWGMPGSAVRLGAAEAVTPLDRIAEAVIALLPKSALS
jgi:two-component system chemotaxis response regulator CheB